MENSGNRGAPARVLRQPAQPCRSSERLRHARGRACVHSQKKAFTKLPRGGPSPAVRPSHGDALAAAGGRVTRARCAGDLHPPAVLAVQLPNRVLGIPGVLKLDKGETWSGRRGGGHHSREHDGARTRSGSGSWAQQGRMVRPATTAARPHNPPPDLQCTAGHPRKRPHPCPRGSLRSSKPRCVQTWRTVGRKRGVNSGGMCSIRRGRGLQWRWRSQRLLP